MRRVNTQQFTWTLMTFPGGSSLGRGKPAGGPEGARSQTLVGCDQLSKRTRKIIPLLPGHDQPQKLQF